MPIPASRMARAMASLPRRRTRLFGSSFNNMRKLGNAIPPSFGESVIAFSLHI